MLTQLTELDAELPILLLATDETNDWESLPDDLRDLFHEEDGEVFHTRPFTDEERRNFFKPLLLEKCLKPPTVKKPSDVKLEVLPLAPAPPPRQLNTVEKERLERKEEATLRELRIFLREVLAKMARNKLFFIFTRPVDLEEVPDYLNIIRQPMDLETMMTKIDQHLYESAKDFLADIELICSNALEYNPDRKPEGKYLIKSPSIYCLYNLLFISQTSRFDTGPALCATLPMLSLKPKWTRTLRSNVRRFRERGKPGRVRWCPFPLLAHRDPARKKQEVVHPSTVKLR